MQGFPGDGIGNHGTAGADDGGDVAAPGGVAAVDGLDGVLGLDEAAARADDHLQTVGPRSVDCGTIGWGNPARGAQEGAIQIDGENVVPACGHGPQRTGGTRYDVDAMVGKGLLDV